MTPKLNDLFKVIHQSTDICEDGDILTSVEHAFGFATGHIYIYQEGQGEKALVTVDLKTAKAIADSINAFYKEFKKERQKFGDWDEYK